MKKTVDIIIPLYNEARVLSASVEKVVAFLDAFPYEYTITLVNNASTDGTGGIGLELSNRFTHVRIIDLTVKGKGIAIREGWNRSNADILSFMDVDLASDLSYFRSLVDSVAIEGFDMAIGNRLGPKSKIIDRRFYREVISRCYNLLIRVLFRTGVTDHQCGFKAISRSAYERLKDLMSEKGFFIDTELIVRARRQRLKINQVDIVWTDSRESKVRVWKTSWELFRAALKLKKDK